MNGFAVVTLLQR